MPNPGALGESALEFGRFFLLNSEVNPEGTFRIGY
jgi:hypothetical protein